MGPLGYHLRLALRDARRNAGLSWAVFAGLAMATAIWTTAVCHYLRMHDRFPPLSPALHQVEIHHPRTPLTPWDGYTEFAGGLLARTQVSFPEYQVLAGSGLASRQSASVRAPALVARTPTAPAQRTVVRFVNADFFQLFPVPLGAGRAFTRSEDHQSQAVAVIGYKLARQLFPEGDALDATLLVDGHPFRIVGAVADHGPQRPVWDIAMTRAQQDAIYLPFSWWQRLLARPEFPLAQAPVGPTFEDLLRSPTLFVSFWLELPTPDGRAAYRQYLDRRFSGPGAPRYQLRDYASWTEEFALPFSDIRFFTILTGLVLLGAGFNGARLLLAKGLARRSELGIHRALGANRLSLFLRQMAEAGLLAAPAALLGVLLSVPYSELFNQLVEINDTPVVLTTGGFVRGFFPALLVGLAAAVYPAWRLSQTGPSGRSQA